MKKLTTILCLCTLLFLSSCATEKKNFLENQISIETTSQHTITSNYETTAPTGTTRRHEWIDEDGDGIEEYVPVYEIWELDLDTVFSDPELTEMFFDQSDFDIRDYDVETILRYPKLKAYCIDCCEIYDFVDMIETPDSSCFSSVGYSPIWEQLIVVFRETGSTYIYDSIPESLANEFLEAESLGSFYNKNIKGQYPCEERAFNLNAKQKEGIFKMGKNIALHNISNDMKKLERRTEK